jgi:sugar lactone lactonase YvrE
VRVVEALVAVAVVAGCTGQDYELGRIEDASNSGGGSGSAATNDPSAVSMTGVASDSASGSGSGSGGETDGSPLVNPLDPVGPIKVFADTGIAMAAGAVYTDVFSGVIVADHAADAVLRINLTGIEVVYEPAGGPRGVGYDADGVLLVAQGDAGRLVRVDGDLVEEVASGLGMPTTVVVSAGGDRYVTDPGSGVFRIDPGGGVHHDVADLPGAAGAALRPDDTFLFVTRTGRSEIHAYPLAADGSLGQRMTFADATAPLSGICVDQWGNVLVVGDAGVEAFRPDGVRWGAVETPAPLVDCSFGRNGSQTVLFLAA